MSDSRSTVKAAVIGAAGYAGIELVRHLLGHPGFELVAATSDGDAGKPLAELYPALLGRCELAFTPHDSVASVDGLGAAFLSVPHTAAMAMAPGLLERGVAVFDLSADFRLRDAAVYEQWYGVAHGAPELLAQAVYGLPELNREKIAGAAAAAAGADGAAGAGAAGSADADTGVASAALIACPGCYPTATTLAVAPALAAGLAAPGAPVIANAISGVSGAGRSATATTHYCSADENVNAYGVTTHRHTPEIAQTLSGVAGWPVPVVFTPHLAPLSRGLLSTVTLQLQTGVSGEQLRAVYEQAYADEPFVTLLPAGSMPRTASVVGSNNAQVGVALDPRTNVLVASCAIDNLGKGAAAQAIQCANIVFGYPETCGLDAIGRIL
ncbi:MAG: N-acetyl-gamma-glutamyl-phosphate reductase [Coriobacteriales bacterium]|nr:N-acetyl-gamma-glutamyl-phosphate reductase [Coriobacteriales bacterium]